MYTVNSIKIVVSNANSQYIDGRLAFVEGIITSNISAGTRLTINEVASKK